MKTDLTISFNYDALASELADELRTAASEIRNLTATASQSAIEIGKRLIAVKANKDHVSHGMFTAWVASECRFSMDTAQKLMRIARFVGGTKTANLRFLVQLSVHALDRLSRAGTPPEVISAFLERIEAKDIPTEGEIKELTRKPRPAKDNATADDDGDDTAPDLYDAWRQSGNGTRAMFVHDHFKAISKLAPMAAVEKARELEANKYKSDVREKDLGNQNSAARRLTGMIKAFSETVLPRIKALAEIEAEIKEPERGELKTAVQELVSAVNALVPQGAMGVRLVVNNIEQADDWLEQGAQNAPPVAESKLFRKTDEWYEHEGPMSTDEVADWKRRADAVAVEANEIMFDRDGAVDFTLRQLIVLNEKCVRADHVAGEIVRALGLPRCRQLASVTEIDDWSAVGSSIKARIVDGDDTAGSDITKIDKRRKRIERKRKEQDRKKRRAG